MNLEEREFQIKMKEMKKETNAISSKIASIVKERRKYEDEVRNTEKNKLKMRTMKRI